MPKTMRPHPSDILHTAGKALLTGLVVWGVLSSPNPGRMVASKAAFDERQQPLRERERRLMAEEDLVLELVGIYSMDQTLVQLVHTEAKRHFAAFSDRMALDGVSTLTHILLGIIREESGGYRLARGDGGRAVGLTQIWTTTARQYGEVEAGDLLDSVTNVRFALLHFSYLLDRYQGDITMALYAWNYGERRLREITSTGNRPRNGYADRVLAALPS